MARKSSNQRFFRSFAWKSIRRNPGRSFFIVFTVSLAVTVSVWVMVFFQGLNHQMKEAVVNTNTGYFQIQDPTYAMTTNADRPLIFTKSLELELVQNGVKGYSPELVLDGFLQTPEGTSALSVIGVVPEFHTRIVPMLQNIIKGSYLTEEDDNSVIIGEQLAKIFHFSVGDTFVVNYQDHLGELRSELLSIKGIYSFNAKSFQSKHIYLTQKTWQKLFFNSVTPEILFNRTVLLKEVLKDGLERKLKEEGMVLRSWKQINPEISVVIEFQNGLMNFCFLIIATTITMTILTPVRMLWQERLKEFKMLKVIGLTQKNAWRLAIQEILIMNIICGAFSFLLLFVVISINSYTGIDFGLIKEGDTVERAGIEMPHVVYPILTWEHLVATVIFVVMVLGLSYAWSIHKTLQSVNTEN